MRKVLDTKKSIFGSQEWFSCHIRFIKTLYYKMWHILLQYATAILLQNATKVYYKMRQKFITKCVKFFIAKSDSYYKMRRFYNKMRQLLQNVASITKCVRIELNTRIKTNIATTFWAVPKLNYLFKSLKIFFRFNMES